MTFRPFAYCLAILCAAAPVLLTPAWAAEPHTITMAGHGEASAAPDRVTINAGVTPDAATAAAALAANTARMKQVFTALEALAVPRKNIQTTNFSVSPQYSNGQNNEARRLTGYQVSNQLRVRLEDVAGLGKALDALVSAGANQMNGIDYAIDDPAPLLDKARGQAIADARTRAQTYARAAGVTLGPIVSICEGCNGGPRPLYRMMAMAAAPSPVPVAAGEETVTADVTVVWEIH
jgi:uncharacterized protein YggE